MSSSRSSPRSIALRLVVLFTLASTLLLCCGFAVLYSIVLRHAFEEDNDVLGDKIAAVRADLENAGGPSILEKELKIAHAGERTAYWIRVLDPAGRTAAETPGMNDILPPHLFPSANAKNVGAKNLRTQG